MFSWLKKLFGCGKENPDDIITGRKAKKVVAKIEKSYWLSEHGVVHNSLCKWYRTCGGKEWDGTGTPEQCGLCGGEHPIVHRWNLK